MKSFQPIRRGKSGPEKKIQDELVRYLTNLGWFVKVTHGNAFSSGWPDLYACHKTYGSRWIEVKLPDMKGSKYTKSQLRDFPKFCANGAGVWVLTGANDRQYELLFRPPNWWQYTSVFKK